jgi:hypothetical protein
MLLVMLTGCSLLTSGLGNVNKPSTPTERHSCTMAPAVVDTVVGVPPALIGGLFVLGSSDQSSESYPSPGATLAIGVGFLAVAALFLGSAYYGYSTHTNCEAQ